jgi:hypothetical protein
MRRLALVMGVALIAAAFAAATRVADTREGLVYEVVTLFAALGGVSFLLYGLVATLSRSAPVAPQAQARAARDSQTHNAVELLVGGSGLLIAAVLLAGIAVTAGPLWALLGLILLLPMLAGCVYLCVRFARSPKREWRLDLQKLKGPR